jgi:hypothetical protein
MKVPIATEHVYRESPMSPMLRATLLAAGVSAWLACGSSSEGPAYLQTRAVAGKPPVLDSVTHVQVIPPPVKTDNGVTTTSRMVTDPDSIAAIVSFIARREATWKKPRSLGDPPRGSMFLDFYTGPALVATVVERGRQVSIQGHSVGLIQKLSRDDKNVLYALAGVRHQ